MSYRHFFGVDPGTHTTGVVSMLIDDKDRSAWIGSKAITGQHHVDKTERFIGRLFDYFGRGDATPVTFVEDYRKRGNSFSQDNQMQTLVRNFRGMKLTEVRVIDNTGSKKVVRDPLLYQLGLTGFGTTHHQDLEAAARIMAYGMLKDDSLNEILTRIVSDGMLDKEWTFRAIPGETLK